MARPKEQGNINAVGGLRRFETNHDSAVSVQMNNAGALSEGCVGSIEAVTPAPNSLCSAIIL
jgi:hypothetical protein